VLVAFGRRPHRVAEVEATIPEKPNELLDLRLGAVAVPDEDEVDVGVGAKLAAAVATDGEERHLVLVRVEDAPEELADDPVDAVGEAFGHAERVVAASMAFPRDAQKLRDVGLDRVNRLE